MTILSMSRLFRLRGRIRIGCTILTTQLPCNGHREAYNRCCREIVTATAPLSEARNAGPDRQAIGISVVNPTQDTVPNPPRAPEAIKRHYAYGHSTPWQDWHYARHRRVRADLAGQHSGHEFSESLSSNPGRNTLCGQPQSWRRGEGSARRKGGAIHRAGRRRQSLGARRARRREEQHPVCLPNDMTGIGVRGPPTSRVPF